MKTLTKTLGTGKQASKLIVFALLVAMIITAFIPLTSSAVYGEEIGGAQPTSGEAVHDLEWTVTFLDIDGTILKTEVVKDGEDATPPNIVKKKGYKFIGWTEWYTNVTEDRTVSAAYELVMTTDDEDDGELGAAGTANPPAEKIAVATEGGLEVIDTSEAGITTPEVIVNNPTPTTVVEDPEDEGMSTTTIVLIILAIAVVLAVVCYFIVMFLKKKRKEEYTS